MNQILDHSGPKRINIKNNPRDMIKIIRVFAILLIIFAICFISKGAYSIVENNKVMKNWQANGSYSEPAIYLSVTDDILTIEVAYNTALEEVSYQWYRGDVSKEEIKAYRETLARQSGEEDNDDEVVEDDGLIKNMGGIETQKGTGETIMKLQNIGVPKDGATIYVEVKAQGGVTADFLQYYYTEVGVDKIKPVINMKIQGKKAIITATDETEIYQLIYSVNEGVETQIDERQDKKTIKTEIDIDDTQVNEILISAVDKAKNTGIYSKPIDIYNGVPSIEFGAEPDFSKIYIYVSYYRGIKSIEYDLNGEKKEIDIDNPKETKEYEFSVDSKVGHNLLSIRVNTEEETVYAEETGECDYNP